MLTIAWLSKFRVYSMKQSFHDNCSFTNDNMCLRLFMSFYLNSKDSFEINVKNIWSNLRLSTMAIRLHTLVENPHFLTKSFQLHDICNYVSTLFFLFWIKLWQLPIMLFRLLYCYIVESIFQPHGHLLNYHGINNVSKLNFQLCW